MLGERIKTRRKELGLTQVELAEECGIPQDEISKIERGRVQDIQTKRLRPLARALDISADWLLEMDKPLQQHRRQS